MSTGTIEALKAPATAVTARGYGRTRLEFDVSECTAEAEEWRPVVGAEGRYEISNLGRVKALPSPHRRVARFLKLKVARKGHLHVNLYLGKGVSGADVNGFKRFWVHRMVLEAFVGPRPGEDQFCRHLNGDPTDNRPENLAWGTLSENEYDKVRHGTHQQGSKTHCPRGHEYTPENTMRISRPSGGRTCRACSRIASLRSRMRYVITCQRCGTNYHSSAEESAKRWLRKHWKTCPINSNVGTLTTQGDTK